MCNQSVGLIQRAVEAAGISTISISLSKEITKKVNPPRSVFPGFPLGHPLGFPGREVQQFMILRLLLKLLQAIDTAGTLVEMNSNGHDVTLNTGRLAVPINSHRKIKWREER